MAFTDALFDGVATLEGVQAQWLADLAAVEMCWATARSIPLVTLPESLLAAAIRFDGIVDATMRRNCIPPDQRNLTACFIGLGPGYAPGHNCHVAIETQWGPSMGQVLLEGAAAERSGGPRALAGVTRARFGIAPAAGIWRTASRLGAAVGVGEAVGTLGEHTIRAPLSGHLRGLARDGVQVSAGQRLVEVDPRSEPQIFGLGERPRAIATGVARALGCGNDATDCAT
jgi:xanthine dehydrogenase accessory factor